MQQQYQIKWNNHSNIFQTALAKCFQSQKFLDVILVVENGNHMIQCHKMVLDATSEYFSNLFKSKLLEDKNPVICLPKEIRLWEIQAILSYMYNGEVCISQDGLASLVKCAELLQVKGLCNKESSSITSAKEDKNYEAKGYDEVGKDIIIKKEINIDDSNYRPEIRETENFTQSECVIDLDKDNYEKRTLALRKETDALIKVKRDLFEHKIDESTERKDLSNSTEESFNIFTNDCRSLEDKRELSSSSLMENPNSYENIVCSPLLQYMNDSEKETTSNDDKMIIDCDDNDDDIYIPNKNAYTNEALYEILSKKVINNSLKMEEKEGNSLIISSVNSLNRCDMSAIQEEGEKKASIGGLYLRNPRANQNRQYDVNALYSALEDVKNGISIYRAAQTYSIPRKTLRNWMKRMEIKSKYPMPKQLAKAAERKKTMQKNVIIKQESRMSSDSPALIY